MLDHKYNLCGLPGQLQHLNIAMAVDAAAIEANVLFTTSGALVDCVDSEQHRWMTVKRLRGLNV